jgi:hypothetical protein
MQKYYSSILGMHLPFKFSDVMNKLDPDHTMKKLDSAMFNMGMGAQKKNYGQGNKKIKPLKFKF